MTNIEKIAIEQSKRYYSFYLYDEATIVSRANSLKKCFPDIDFLYSIKTNPHKEVAKTLFNEGFGLDAASYNEVLMGYENGLPKDKIYYSAPGKTKEDIEGSIDKSFITADSLNEVLLINEVAKLNSLKVKIGIRINPNFSFYTSEGAANKFGVDEDQLFANAEMIKSLSHVEFCGIHVHSRSQELDSERIKHYYNKMFELILKVSEVFSTKLDFVNFGGGLGIDFAPTDKPLDVEAVGAEMSRLISEFKAKLSGVKLFVETGRYTIGKAGIYVTKVLDKKVSHGKTYVILSNTLNGFVRPAMITMIEHYVGKTEDSFEPMFTKSAAFQFKALTEEKATEKVTLCGNLCTGTDVIATDIEMPVLKIGDVITMTNAGAYAAVMTPMEFASLKKPAQLFITKEGIVK